jgi:hypothetical protein
MPVRKSAWKTPAPAWPSSRRSTTSGSAAPLPSPAIKGAHNLLERATYKFEAVSSQGKAWRIEPLGEVTVTQSLTQKQRTALVEGTLVSRPGEAVLEYRLKGEVVRIDTGKLVAISSDDLFASLEKRLGGFVVGLEAETTEPKSPRAKEAAKAEQAAIIEADKKSAKRTAVPPVDESKVANQRATENRGVAGGRVAAEERAITRPALATTQPAALLPNQAELESRLNSVSRRAPTADEVETLERNLSRGETEVASAGRGEGMRVSMKPSNSIVGTGAMAAAGFLPAITGALVQGAISSKVTSAIENGTRWIDSHYPPAQTYLKEEEKLRKKALEAKDALETSGSVWERMLARGMPIGKQGYDRAHEYVQMHLQALEAYDRRIYSRNSILAGKRNELDRLLNEVNVYVAALYKLAQELEDKVVLACSLPAGYYFGLELLGWSQYVHGVAGRMSPLLAAMEARESDYSKAMDDGTKRRDEMDIIDDHWVAIMMKAVQSAGL